MAIEMPSRRMRRRQPPSVATSPPAPPALRLLQDEGQMFQRQLEIVIQTHHQLVLALVVQPMVLSAVSRPADDLAGALIAGED